MAIYITQEERDPRTHRPLKHVDLWCAARGQALDCSIPHQGNRPLPRWVRADGIEIRLVENPDHGKDSFDTSSHIYDRCPLCFAPRMLRQETGRGRVYAGQRPLPLSPPPAWLLGAIAAASTDAPAGGYVYELTYEPLRVKHIGGARDASWLRRRLLDHYRKTCRGEGIWWWYDLMSKEGTGVQIGLQIFGPLGGRYHDVENERRSTVWHEGWQNSTLV